MILFLLVLALPVTVSASVSVVNPLDEQLPLIARVGQYYHWSISPDTFTSTSDASFTASSPGWLSFNASSKAFSGTPSPQDQGFPEVTVTAHENGSSISSSCNIYVTDEPAPTLNIPLDQQFYEGNPSLSSVFMISQNSSLSTGVPALRIPNGWSFSIGFSSETFKDDEGNVIYDISQRDGSILPEFLDWNETELTIGGVTPRQRSLPSPTTFALALRASDKDGYTASTLPFDIVIANHDLSTHRESLPTINVTALTPFNFTLSSPSDFVGVQIDDQPIHPANISTLSVDISGYDDWLSYDANRRLLSGKAEEPERQTTQGVHLPVTLLALNQTIHTRLSISVVPSFFVDDQLPNFVVPEDGSVSFFLQPYFSNATGDNPSDVELSVSYDFPEAAQYLAYDSSTFEIRGRLPSDFPSSLITTTFTAYSPYTHTTSHSTLSLSYDAPRRNSAQGNRHHSPGLSLAVHRKLVLGLSIAFGIIGGVCALAVLLAICRRVSQVQDTALTGVEAQKWWSETDKKWYGAKEHSGYGWTQDIEKQHSAMDLPRLSQSHGLEIGFPPKTSPSPALTDTHNSAINIQSPGLMKKGEFMNRIRATVHRVSDKYGSVRVKPPIVVKSHGVPIGKPILLNASPDDPSSSSRLDGSPTTVIASPATVHFVDRLPNSRRFSADSGDSLASIQTHAKEAIVQTATRVPSLSHPSVPESLRIGNGPSRPRLVPFTSVTRVPHPQSPGSSSPESGGSVGSRRITSQTATASVWQKVNEDHSPSSDDLSVGIQYVRALGSDNMPVNNATSMLTVSTNMRSSFSSLESSEAGHVRECCVRMIVRAGEEFKFKIPLPATGSPELRHRDLIAKLATGMSLPKFLDVNLQRSTGVEFSGVASANDIGDLDIVICPAYDLNTCLARVLLQIAGNQ